MKEETKELIKWIKEACNSFVYASEDFKTNLSRDKLCDEAEEFLDSLSDIELRLCMGGYVQDKNGAPCCDGDRIKVHGFIDGEEDTVYGTLRYGFMKGEEKKYMIFPHWWFDLDNNASCLPEEGFEKVEK